jgi:NTE family protein
MLSHFFSPYELNPLNYNPLRKVLSRVIDFEALRTGGKVKFFTSAANVLTGRLRVFECHEQSVDTVLASACMPFGFQAVEVNGEHYWDGGYMGNPPIFPLIYHCESRDVVLVMINPIVIDKVPTSARAIMNRINTLSFNSSLMREMRAINFVSRLVDNGFDDEGRLKKMLIHCIDAEEKMRELGESSKLNANWDFLMYLRELGRERGEAFLHVHYDKLGRESSTPIAERFL